MLISENETSSVVRLLEAAGKEILRIFYSPDDFGVNLKEDKSPVTRADLVSDSVIKAGLGKITLGIPVFSEETKDVSFDIRKKWNPLWILDPLDGTKEFIARNEEFCISLALIFDNKPFAGFIHHPVSGITWFAVRGQGSYRLNGKKKVILPVVTPKGAIRINISRNHHSSAEEAWINDIRTRHNVEKIICGSAVKFCKIAEGYSDLYPKFGLINEWDIAAGHIILEETGGEIIELPDGKSPVYNKPDYHQPPFIACGTRGKKIVKGKLLKNITES